MGRSFKRRPPTRELKRKILIICEGKETEFNYFNAIRQDMRLPTLQVIVEHPNKTDPRSIVQAAINRRDEIKRDRNQTWTNDDMVWAVFDGDEHKQSNPTNWNDAIQKAQGNKIHLAVSNPCFELWFLLHFQDQNANIHRDDTRRQLCRHISNYEKAMIVYPTFLKSLTEEAVTRAQRLIRNLATADLADYSNPSTGVWEVVQILLALTESES